MTAPRKPPTSPCKGEVDREAGGWGSRFSRTKDMPSDLVAHTERLAQAATTPTPTLPLLGGGRTTDVPTASKKGDRR